MGPKKVEKNKKELKQPLPSTSHETEQKRVSSSSGSDSEKDDSMFEYAKRYRNRSNREKTGTSGRKQSAKQEIPMEERMLRFRFQSFDPELEEWKYYVMRFENELVLHGLNDNISSDDVRRQLLLARVGPEGFKILVDHFHPISVNSKNYNEVKEVLSNFYSKSTCIIAERMTFNATIRREGESVRQFLAKLRSQSSMCEFGQSLEERLRDQLVIGINETRWQKEVLKSHPSNRATLKEVEETLLALEQAHIQQGKIWDLAQNRRGGFTDTNKVGERKGFNFKGRREQIKELERGVDCLACGWKIHRKNEKCPALDKVCSYCSQKNHFARVCLKSGRAIIVGGKQDKERGRETRKIKCNSEETTSDSEDGVRKGINAVAEGTKGMLDVYLNGCKVEMLYDPGACQSVVCESLWKKIGSPKLIPTRSLTAYTDVTIRTLGKANVEVSAFGKVKHLPIYVVEAHEVPLFGFSWTLAFDLPLPPGLRICKLNKVERLRRQEENQKKVVAKEDSEHKKEIEILKYEFKELFNEDLGKIQGCKAKIHMRPDAVPKVFKPRPVPFALKNKVELELKRLVSMGVLEAVDPFTTAIEWASPIVIAPKPNDKIRICADFKVTINPYMIIDRHPLPRLEDIWVKLSGGKNFTTVDLRDAYLQLEVDESCKKYFVLATHMGYFVFKRLPFGVSSAPSIFQRIMDTVLSDLTGVACYLDDIIVTGQTTGEHMNNLRNVLRRLKDWGMRVKLEKCKWLEKEICYLGHRLDQKGIHPTEEHVKAIQRMPAPKNQKELRSFLGSINYYSRFVPHLQTMCAPLHRLLKKNARWEWSKNDDATFLELKGVITSSSSLAHYNPGRRTILAADASELGVGAVLFQEQEDGSEKPVAFASRTLQLAEKKYSSLDREALAIIFGVEKFDQFIYGKKFTLRTDHKPLMYLFGENKEIPKTAANRVTRWALLLSAYSYKIEFVSGKHNAPADALSRLPLEEDSTHKNLTDEWLDNNLFQLRFEDFPVTKRKLQKYTMEDPILSKVIGYMNRGWPEKNQIKEESLTPFYVKREELSYEDSVLMWQGRIIVPVRLREAILNMVHTGHPGIVAMKSIAKFQVWWPKMSEEIENFVKSCTSCQKVRPKDAEAPLYSWSMPAEPWSRLHIDYAGPVEGYYWLVVIDAYSKWLEVLPTKVTSTCKTVELLRTLFAQFGLPKTLVSDNGPQFASYDFGQFCKGNNIKHIKVTPYHPKSNGLAERAVRTFKERFLATGPGDRNVRLAQVLLAYRNAEQATTGRSPAELIFGKRIKTRIDLLKPSLDTKVDQEITKQKLYHDQHIKEREFKEGDKVWVLNRGGKGFVEGTVATRTGPLSYMVLVGELEKRYHADQMRARYNDAVSLADGTTTTPAGGSNEKGEV